MKYYCIATTPRSGTHFLMGLLKNQGAGNPKEYLYQMVHGTKIRSILSMDELHELGAIDDYFGIAIHPLHIEQGVSILKKWLGITNATDFEVLNAAFPGIKFIYLYRLNKIKQAISVVKALRDGRWFGGNNFGNYSRLEITNAISSTCKQESYWLDFFIENKITPHFVTYEELCIDPEKHIKTICDFLDLNKSVINIDDASLPEIQYDKTNEDWYQRYQEDILNLPTIRRFHRISQ